MKAWITVLLLACVPAASAQTIYRCVRKGRPPAYQTEPCAPDTAGTVRHFAAPRPISAQEALRRRIQAERDSAYLSRLAGRSPYGASGVAASLPNTDARDSACSRARSERDAWERAAGLQRSYDSVRSWNERVSQACR